MNRVTVAIIVAIVLAELVVMGMIKGLDVLADRRPTDAVFRLGWWALAASCALLAFFYLQALLLVFGVSDRVLWHGSLWAAGVGLSGVSVATAVFGSYRSGLFLALAATAAAVWALAFWANTAFGAA